ncbi:MAG: rRNA pseudouridine synthase [Cyanobacteria bacterium SBLK]|nr:rRNA pseudouridine synthase [Cyanobacteria bacterium SBLK]
MQERVQKIISQYGIASRRQAEAAILAGRVRVNGQLAYLGQKADLLAGDRLEIDGLAIAAQPPDKVYILLNKPKGVVCTCRDPQKRKTVLDLLPPQYRQGEGIHPVGRLDINSTGALILTNDGDFTLALTHPRYHLPKTYRVWVKGHPSQSILQQWRQGVILLGRTTLPARVDILKCNENGTCLEIVLKEGKNRQIRRIAEQLGYPVMRLHRSAIGSLSLKSRDLPFLKPGCYRLLSESEIRILSSGFPSSSSQFLSALKKPVDSRRPS